MPKARGMMLTDAVIACIRANRALVHGKSAERKSMPCSVVVKGAASLRRIRLSTVPIATSRVLSFDCPSLSSFAFPNLNPILQAYPMSQMTPPSPLRCVVLLRVKSPTTNRVVPEAWLDIA